MANITRFTPFDDMFDDVLRGFFVRPVAFEGPGAGAPQFRVDVTEDNGAYTVRADIPGVKKDDIHITIDGNQVGISAEVKREKDVKEGERVLRSERYYGKTSRTFSLDQEVDEAAASAKYANGVLELTLPKKVAPKAKRIAIQ